MHVCSHIVGPRRMDRSCHPPKRQGQDLFNGRQGNLSSEPRTKSVPGAGEKPHGLASMRKRTAIKR